MTARIPAVLAPRWGLTSLLAGCLLCLVTAISATAAGKGHGKVWLVFFSSNECPLCSNVDMLIRGLSAKYPLGVKKFVVERPQDYDLLERLQKIHSDGVEFGVPLVMVGESILVGEQEISSKLEPAVRMLSGAGGASLPYLGPSKPPPAKKAPTPEGTKCGTKSSVSSDVWSKVRSFLDRLFPDPVLR